MLKSSIDSRGCAQQSLGFSYDWQRELATCDVQYYHWTQASVLAAL